MIEVTPPINTENLTPGNQEQPTPPAAPQLGVESNPQQGFQPDGSFISKENLLISAEDIIQPPSPTNNEVGGAKPVTAENAQSVEQANQEEFGLLTLEYNMDHLALSRTAEGHMQRGETEKAFAVMKAAIRARNAESQSKLVDVLGGFDPRALGGLTDAVTAVAAAMNSSRP